MQVVFDSIDANNWIIFGLALLAMAVGFLIGRLYGGPDWGISARTGAAVAFITGGLIFIDQVMQVWPPYFKALSGRPDPDVR